jgi:non-ribosomal peptide synthetase component F
MMANSRRGYGDGPALSGLQQATTTDNASLSILNPFPTVQQGPSLLHDLVQQPSENVALLHKDGENTISYSYREIHDVSDKLAKRLKATREPIAGRQHPFIVPVLISQSPLLYISLLAILKAGGAFCPLNLDAPPERIRFILNDVSATVMLAGAELAKRLPQNLEVDIITVEDNEQLHNHSSSTHDTGARPQDLAYVMYTSGSTGTPKGVAISHQAATQALLAHQSHIPHFKRFLQFAAPTFDVSVFEIFFPLFRGSTLVSARREELLDNLPKVLQDLQVDGCELTPTVAGSLLRSRNSAPELKTLLTIGEMLTVPVIQEFGGDRNQESMLQAMYGPTEATIHW